MDDFFNEPAPATPTPRMRRTSSAPLFLISSLLTVGVGGAVIALIQSTRSVAARGSAGGRDDVRYATFSARAKPASLPSVADDRVNMVGEARDAVNIVLQDAVSAVPAASTVAKPAAGPAPASASRPPTRPAEIGSEERSSMSGLFGKWDPETATFVGSTPGLLYNVADRLARHPALLRFLFNNDWVIQGLMGQSEVRRNCSTSRALVDYLTDMKRKTGGVSSALQAMSALQRNPQSLETFFQSRMAGTMIAGCPAMVETMKDQGAMIEIFTKNPAIARTLADPVVISAMSSGTASQQLYGEYARLQTQLGARR